MWLFDRECIRINRSNMTTIYFLETIKMMNTLSVHERINS